MANSKGKGGPRGPGSRVSGKTEGTSIRNTTPTNSFAVDYARRTKATLGPAVVKTGNTGSRVNNDSTTTIPGFGGPRGRSGNRVSK